VGPREEELPDGERTLPARLAHHGLLALGAFSCGCTGGVVHRLVVAYGNSPLTTFKAVGLKTQQAQVWSCPMHPEVRAKAPGTCPICKMDLVPGTNSGATETSELRALSIRSEIFSRWAWNPAGLARITKPDLRLFARVAADPSKVVRLHVRATGFVEELYGTLGSQWSADNRCLLSTATNSPNWTGTGARPTLGSGGGRSASRAPSHLRDEPRSTRSH